MEFPQFEQMVARLEAKSRQSPAAYKTNVALLALLGFVMLAVVLGTATAAILALVALPFLLWMGGIHVAAALFGLGKFLVLLALPIWFFVKSSVSSLFQRLPVPKGLELHRDQAPDLFAAMAAMRRQMHGPRFHHVLVSEELNASVMQRPLFGLMGPARNYLILGLPLLECLSPEEALAVVAHEYGHLAGSHSYFAAFIYRLRNSWGTALAISQQWRGFVGSAMGRMVGWYAPYFNAYTFVLARANEYQADAAAAELVGVEVTTSALKRVDVSAAHYGKFMQRTFRQIASSAMPPPDLSAQWASVAHAAPEDQAQRWLQRALRVEAAVHDTHPPLRERLRALQGDDAVLAASVPTNLEGPTAAQAWLGASADLVREKIQTEWRDRVANAWKERHEEVDKQKRRLEELLSLDEPTLDEHAERLRASLDLHPESDLSNDFATFIERHPGSALGPYLMGCWRLANDHEDGLQHLERAVALDRDATKPACEKAFEYLTERGDPRADAYRKRWNERDRMDQVVAGQLQQLDVEHELRDPDLTDGELTVVLNLVKAHHDGIAKAYLARRVLPADRERRTYVLALDLEPAPPRVETPHQIVDRLAGTEGWPMHVIVCVLEGKNAALGPRLRFLAQAELRLFP